MNYNQFTGIKGNKYEFYDEYYIGFTSNTNEPFYIDKEDYDKVKDYTWLARHDKRKGRDNSYYIEARYKETIEGKKHQYRVHLHHLVLNIIDGIHNNIIVDHINRNKADCRKENLRIVDRRINSLNREAQITNKTGIIGVEFSVPQNKWIARISPYLNCRITLYQGKDKNKAIKARLNAELYYYQEDAPQKHLFEQYNITKESAIKFIQRINNKLSDNNTSGITGVYWDKRNKKWLAYINIDKKRKLLCRTYDKSIAIKTRLEAEIKYYSEGKRQKHLWKEYGIKNE